MVLTEKVWCPTQEPMPEGLFNTTSCPEAPPHWFRECPELAAELYALEIHKGKSEETYHVAVLDSTAARHTFTVRIFPTTGCTISSP